MELVSEFRVFQWPGMSKSQKEDASKFSMGTRVLLKHTGEAGIIERPIVLADKEAVLVRFDGRSVERIYTFLLEEER